MKRLLWTHIATTGLNPNVDRIIELYMKVTDVRGEDIDGVERVFYSGLPETVLPGALNVEAMRIHARSGLLTDLQERRVKQWDSVESLDAEIVDCLAELDGHDIILAGYAPRFAYEFIRGDLPMTCERLHFQHLDVTSLEAFMDTALGHVVCPRPQALRVRAKVDSAILQYRVYLGVLEGLARS